MRQEKQKKNKMQATTTTTKITYINKNVYKEQHKRCIVKIIVVIIDRTEESKRNHFIFRRLGRMLLCEQFDIVEVAEVVQIGIERIDEQVEVGVVQLLRLLLLLFDECKNVGDLLIMLLLLLMLLLKLGVVRVL